MGAVEVRDKPVVDDQLVDMAVKGVRTDVDIVDGGEQRSGASLGKVVAFTVAAARVSNAGDELPGGVAAKDIGHTAPIEIGAHIGIDNVKRS